MCFSEHPSKDNNAHAKGCWHYREETAAQGGTVDDQCARTIRSDGWDKLHHQTTATSQQWYRNARGMRHQTKMCVMAIEEKRADAETECGDRAAPLDKQKTEHEGHYTLHLGMFSFLLRFPCITWWKTCAPSVECAPADKIITHRAPISSLWKPWLCCVSSMAALASRQEGGRVVFRCCTSLTCTFAPLCKASEAGVPSSGLLCDRYSSGIAASIVCLSLSVRGHIPCQPANILISMVRQEKKHAHREFWSPK